MHQEDYFVNLCVFVFLVVKDLRWTDTTVNPVETVVGRLYHHNL